METSVLKDAYKFFNGREIDGVLRLMHPDVDWPNGWEGGWLKGHEAVREYWTRQWNEIDSRVDPVKFSMDEGGRIVADVHAVIRDQNGTLLAEEFIQHVYTLQDGLIRRMEIRKQS